MNVQRPTDGRIGGQRDPLMASAPDARSPARSEIRRESRAVSMGVDAEEDSEGLDIKALYRFFLRRRWVMLGVGSLLGGLVFIATMLQTPKYESAALVLIQPQQGELALKADTVHDDVNPDTGAIESQIEILQSRKLAGRLVDRLQLAADPEWNSALKPSPIAALFGAKAVVAKKVPKLSKSEREQIVDRVAGSVLARRKGLTYVIEVVATTHDPKLSAKMANEMVALYFESQLQMRLDASRSANAWLSERLALLKTEVQQKEAAVEAYRAQSGLLTAAGNSLTEQQIMGLQGSVLQARTDLAERQARYQQVQSIIRSGGSPDSIAGVINSATILTLRAQEAEAARKQADLESRYGELHPALEKARVERAGIQQQIRAEVARIADSLKNEVDVAQARLATLVGNQASVQGELVSNNSGMVKLRELERDANATRGIYESFLKRYQELTESESLKITDASLVGEATPATGKSSPKLSIALLLGLAVGAALGGAVGLAIDMMDEGLDGAAAVEKGTGKTVLASIPIVWPEEVGYVPHQQFEGLRHELVKVSNLQDVSRVIKHGRVAFRAGGLKALLGGQSALNAAAQSSSDGQNGGFGMEPKVWHPATYLVEKPMSAFAEGIRSLRTSLLYTGLERRVKVVAVTSAMPGDGKTTTSVCLTRVAGLSGQKAIIVECDLRRRSLNGVLGLKPRIGMLQILRGEVRWQDVLIRDEFTGVHVLPAAEDSFTPWDVFGSQAMVDLLDELSNHYDLVVLDCPPVLAVAETRIICRLADETVLVVRWAHTPARAANGAIELIEQCGGNVIGIAINCVDPQAPGRGSYGDVTYQARYAGEYYHS